MGLTLAQLAQADDCEFLMGNQQEYTACANQCAFSGEQCNEMAVKIRELEDTIKDFPNDIQTQEELDLAKEKLREMARAANEAKQRIELIRLDMKALKAQSYAEWVAPIVIAVYASDRFSDGSVSDQLLWGSAGLGVGFSIEKTTGGLSQFEWVQKPFLKLIDLDIPW